MTIPVAQLWTSTDQAQWEAVLDQYWNSVRPDRFDLEYEMERLTPAAIENLDAEQWHMFLRDKYFRWKYTAPNRYATTTACLKRQAEKEGLDALLRIRDRILTVADGPVETALNTVCEISGLGPAGASGLLALLYPRAFGTFDQFVTKALCAVPMLPERERLLRMRPESLTVQDGAVLIWIMREKAAWLNAAFGTDSWTPRKVDMVLWTCGH